MKPSKAIEKLTGYLKTAKVKCPDIKALYIHYRDGYVVVLNDENERQSIELPTEKKGRNPSG